MTPGMLLGLDHGHRRDIKNGDHPVPRILDFQTDTRILAEDRNLREAQKPSTILAGVQAQDQILDHLLHLALVVEVPRSGLNSVSFEMRHPWGQIVLSGTATLTEEPGRRPQG